LAKHAHSCIILFRSTPNFSILELCSYQPSCWVMDDWCHQGVIRLYLHMSTKKQENSQAVRLEHVATSVSASTEFPPSMLHLLLPQHPCNEHPCNVTQIMPPS
jgi:hypothetical protein